MSPSCLIEVYTTKANRISDALKYDMWQVITRCPPISSSWLCGLLLRCWETDKCWLTLNIGSSWGIKIASQIPRHLITLQNNTWCIVIRRLTSCMPKRASCFPTRSAPYLVLPFDRQYRIAIHRKCTGDLSTDAAQLYLFRFMVFLLLLMVLFWTVCKCFRRINRCWSGVVIFDAPIEDYTLSKINSGVMVTKQLSYSIPSCYTG